MKNENNLVWMDLEMTGLDPEKDTILEIATVITDSHLRPVQEGPCLAIHQPDQVLENMDPWCIDHHGASGLTKRVRESKVTLKEAEDRTLAFIQEYCPEKTSPLCGSSVHQDRRFLVKYMPRISDYLHYRIIDVSTVKELVQRWYPYDEKPFQKSKNHLAMEDVKSSIAELVFYKENFFK